MWYDGWYNQSLTDHRSLDGPSMQAIKEAAADFRAGKKTLERTWDAIIGAYGDVTQSIKSFDQVNWDKDKLWANIITVYGNADTCLNCLNSLRQNVERLRDELRRHADFVHTEGAGSLTSEDEQLWRRLTLVCRAAATVLAGAALVALLTGIGAPAAAGLGGAATLTSAAAEFCKTMAESK